MTAPSCSCPSCGMTEIDRVDLGFPLEVARRRLDARHKGQACNGKRNDFEYHSGFAITQGKDT